MRRPLIAGNWKMHLSLADSARLAGEIRERAGAVSDRDVALFPTLVSVAAVAEALVGSPIQTGGQNCSGEEQGAFTGEVSADILRSSGATMVLVGHSERRHVMGESDEEVRRKVEAALRHDLQPVVCVGETLEQREGNQTLAVVEGQVRKALVGLPPERLARTILAYEPVWAIGTGRVATPEQAQEVHAAIRGFLREIAGPAGEQLRILYGGSVKGANVDGLMKMPDIDGALVGGAALDAEDFARIIHFRTGSD